MIANISYPPLSKYMRAKVRRLLIASRVWIVTYCDKTVPCYLCPPNSGRVSSRTLIGGTHLNIQGRDTVYVCYKCMGRLHFDREKAGQQ